MDWKNSVIYLSHFIGKWWNLWITFHCPGEAKVISISHTKCCNLVPNKQCQRWALRTIVSLKPNHLKARVQAVAASTKARSTIPMLGKGSKTRQGRGSWSDPSKRSTGIHLVIQPQPAGPGWIFWRWQILIVTLLSSKCKLIGLPIGKSTAQIAPIFN